jgi:hypothetical protein
LASTWQVLKVKLEYHSNPLVVGGLCDLFSLVPLLVVETKEYEVSIIKVALFLPNCWLHLFYRHR